MTERPTLLGTDDASIEGVSIEARVRKVVVIGLGYVGLPLAVALSGRFNVIGFDIDPTRIGELDAGFDRTGEVDANDLADATCAFTADQTACQGADVYIVTVPTPVDGDNRPDLTLVKRASAMVAGMIDPARKPIVVFESTVYPGVTEEICGPLIEREAGLVHRRDFFLGYSPERINPGDRTHRLDSIVKVVAGDSAETIETLAALYGAITRAGVFKAASIRVAEAAKVIENAQRDINIAFMNEVTQIFSRMDFSIWDVLDAARTKWNFLPFQPGLVGGHCIGVDPYYLSYRAQQLGHDPQVILAGRSTNDHMGTWVAESIHAARGGAAGTALVLGLSFKENVPDLRNSRVVDMIARLGELGHRIAIHDPRVAPEEAESEYGLQLDANALSQRYDLIVVAVAHDEYRDLTVPAIEAMVAPGGLIADLKGIWRGLAFSNGIARWSL